MELLSAYAVEFNAVPPQWLVFATSFIVALVLAGIFIGAIWLIWRGRQRSSSSLQQLAHEAQEALDALQAGGDLKDIVMRCYREMNRVVRDRRGLQRHEAMTSQEFARHLAALGLPGEHVWRLTRLFEDVRYGARPPGEQEERQAIACLAAIVETCRETS